jgi:hypothetical protein
VFALPWGEWRGRFGATCQGPGADSIRYREGCLRLHQASDALGRPGDFANRNLPTNPGFFDASERICSVLGCF